MKNAAYRLAERLIEWELPPNAKPENHRRSEGDDGPMALWSVQARAVADLIEVERTLEGMKAAGENVAMYEETVPSWYEAVFAYTTPWQSAHGSERPVIDPRDLRLLQALGSTIDQAGRIEIGADTIKAIRAALDEAEQLLVDDVTLPQHARHYLWGLITEARRYLDEVDLFGAEAVRRVALELSGACVTQSERYEATNDKEKAGRWRNLAKTIATQSFIASVAEIAAAGGMTAIGG